MNQTYSFSYKCLKSERAKIEQQKCMEELMGEYIF